MERDIGLNLGSMLPWSAVPVGGLPIAAWMTRKSGYAFWQVLPFRSVSVAGLVRTGIPVRFVEPAWNATTFLAHFRGMLGAEGMKTKLQDPLFFSDPEKCALIFAGIVDHFSAETVYHHLSMLGKGGLIELHPGLGSLKEVAAKIAEEAHRGPLFAIDLRHLRRFPNEGEACQPLWKAVLDTFLPYTSLIHVQAIDGREWQGFINGEPTELTEMLQFVRDWGYDGPFVVEYDPRATGLSGLLPWRLVANLKRVRERVEECLA